MAGDGTPIIIKKKKAHAHAHHGGSWKVAYADFVTAMMAFFMVMWILGLSDDAKAEISGYFNDPFGYSRTAPMSRNIISFPGAPVTGGRVKKQKMDAVTKDMKAIIMIGDKLVKALGKDEHAGDKGTKTNPQPRSLDELLDSIEIDVTPEGLRVEFKEDKGSVFFETGSAKLRPEAVIIINRLATVLSEVGRRMFIEGHTDSRPYSPGAPYDNWDLSQGRANTMRRAMEHGGVKQKMFLGIHGYADQRLKLPTEPLNPANRRVSILLPITDDPLSTSDVSPDTIDLKPTIELSENKPIKEPGHTKKKSFF